MSAEWLLTICRCSVAEAMATSRYMNIMLRVEIFLDDHGDLNMMDGANLARWLRQRSCLYNHWIDILNLPPRGFCISSLVSWRAEPFKICCDMIKL